MHTNIMEHELYRYLNNNYIIILVTLCSPTLISNGFCLCSLFGNTRLCTVSIKQMYGAYMGNLNAGTWSVCMHLLCV